MEFETYAEFRHSVMVFAHCLDVIGTGPNQIRVLIPDRHWHGVYMAIVTSLPDQAGQNVLRYCGITFERSS